MRTRSNFCASKATSYVKPTENDVRRQSELTVIGPIPLATANALSDNMDQTVRGQGGSLHVTGTWLGCFSFYHHLTPAGYATLSVTHRLRRLMAT